MPKLTKQRLEEILVEGIRLKDPEFHLRNVEGRLSGSVISPSFAGKRDHERQQMIWDSLERVLGADSVRLVGLLLAYTPEEWNLDHQLASA